MKTAYVALGSNLGNSQAILQQALGQLAKLPDSQLKGCSSVYQSAAIGGPNKQPDFLNAVCCLKTSLTPLSLLHLMQRIEQQAGRTRLTHWGPRTLDLDLIHYEGHSCQTDELSLPHPNAHQRAFVLVPLQELGAGFTLGEKNLAHWLAKTRDQRLEKIGCLT